MRMKSINASLQWATADWHGFLDALGFDTTNAKFSHWMMTIITWFKVKSNTQYV